jgi:hypothetical protein
MTPPATFASLALGLRLDAMNVRNGDGNAVDADLLLRVAELLEDLDQALHANPTLLAVALRQANDR